MFKKMFGKKKKSSGTAPLDDSIRTAVVGDVIVIPGFSPTFEDAYFIVESKNRLESAYGNTFEIIAVDDDHRVSMEWSDDDDSSIAVTDHDNAMGLSVIGIEEDTLASGTISSLLRISWSSGAKTTTIATATRSIITKTERPRAKVSGYGTSATRTTNGEFRW